MNASDAREKIRVVKAGLEQLKELMGIDKSAFELDEHGQPSIDRAWDMSAEFSDWDLKAKECWRGIVENLPPGFSLGADILRHRSFNQAQDWYDISTYDIPQELGRAEQYLTRLNLVEYVESLHPAVSRVSGVVLEGDLDAALKTIYASLEAKIREHLHVPSGQSTVPYIAKAFKDGALSYPDAQYNDSVRNFLMGVVGFYRAQVIHKSLPTSRNTIDASLSLFALAHETFGLFDNCIG